MWIEDFVWHVQIFFFALVEQKMIPYKSLFKILFSFKMAHNSDILSYFLPLIIL